MLRNPFYAGAYAYGKSGSQTTIVDGRAHKTYKYRKPLDQWDVVVKEHHEGYIDWAEFERNQKALAANAYGKAGDVKSGRRASPACRDAWMWTLRPAPVGGLYWTHPATGLSMLSL